MGVFWIPFILISKNLLSMYSQSDICTGSGSAVGNFPRLLSPYPGIHGVLREVQSSQVHAVQICTMA